MNKQQYISHKIKEYYKNKYINDQALKIKL